MPADRLADAMLEFEITFSSQSLNVTRDARFAETSSFHPIVDTNGKVCLDSMERLRQLILVDAIQRSTGHSK
jgi:hypothetical protein